MKNTEGKLRSRHRESAHALAETRRERHDRRGNDEAAEHHTLFARRRSRASDASGRVRLIANKREKARSRNRQKRNVRQAPLGHDARPHVIQRRRQNKRKRAIGERLSKRKGAVHPARTQAQHRSSHARQHGKHHEHRRRSRHAGKAHEKRRHARHTAERRNNNSVVNKIGSLAPRRRRGKHGNRNGHRGKQIHEEDVVRTKLVREQPQGINAVVAQPNPPPTRRQGPNSPNRATAPKALAFLVPYELRPWRTPYALPLE